MNRQEIKEYALRICLPLMERQQRRFENGDYGFKSDAVGFVPTYLENLCRPFWGIAPILAAGEKVEIPTKNGSISVFQYLHDQLLAGLTSGKETSWDQYRECFGAYVYENQNITELAGLCLGLFFAKEQLWDPFTEEEKAFIAESLYEMSAIAFDHSWPNNHYWFPLFCVTVLKRFGFEFPRTKEMLDTGLEFLDRLYIGDGWYKDGEFGRFDYYEAWSLHTYPLLWTLIADESFNNYEKYKKSYLERTNQFLDFYTHWFAANGNQVPFGRSLAYRFAASVLFPASILAGCDFDASLAGRVTEKNIEFFKENYKSETPDLMEEGYLYHSPSVVEGYTSDGGAYWCCKTFLCLLLPEDHDFWKVEGVKTPAEAGDYLVAPQNKEIHMLFEAHDGLVTMYNNTAQYYLKGKMTHHFSDMRGMYSKFAYNSASGFALNSADNAALDNMISVVTPDTAMESHRLGYEDLGYEDGVLRSVHQPYANDAKTKIETFMIPLGGKHVRVQHITLSQEYSIKEGGFSLGRWDDFCGVTKSEFGIAIKNHEYTSEIASVGTVDLSYGTGSPQAGFHLFAPLASYPLVRTDVLQAGEYWISSAFAISKNGKEESLENLQKLAKYYLDKFLTK